MCDDCCVGAKRCIPSRVVQRRVPSNMMCLSRSFGTDQSYTADEVIGELRIKKIIRQAAKVKFDGSTIALNGVVRTDIDKALRSKVAL